jgi:hypothetical protein
VDYRCMRLWVSEERFGEPKTSEHKWPLVFFCRDGLSLTREAPQGASAIRWAGDIKGVPGKASRETSWRARQLAGDEEGTLPANGPLKGRNHMACPQTRRPTPVRSYVRRAGIREGVDTGHPGFFCLGPRRQSSKRRLGRAASYVDRGRPRTSAPATTPLPTQRPGPSRPPRPS